MEEKRVLLFISNPRRTNSCSRLSVSRAEALYLKRPPNCLRGPGAAELASKIRKGPVLKVLGVGQATDTIALAQRKDITRLKATELAAERAYKMAALTP